jgi:ribosome-binding protein aMBF1 (putative translation factor)
MRKPTVVQLIRAQEAARQRGNDARVRKLEKIIQIALKEVRSL